VADRLDWAFLLAALVGCVLALVDPGLVPFVVAGIALGLSALAVPRWRRYRASRASSRRLSIGVGVGVAALAGLAVVVALLGGGQSSHQAAPRRSAEIEGTLTATIDYDDRTESLNIDETLSLPRDNVDGASTEEALVTAMASLGWTETTNSNLRLVFRHSDTQAAKHHSVLPAEQTNVLALSTPTLELEQVPDQPVTVSFLLDDRSGAVVSAPQYTIGDTFPAAPDPQTRPSDRRQFFHMPVDTETESLEFELRSPPFRNEALATLVNVTAWSPFRWLLTASILLASEGFRTSLKTALGRVFGPDTTPKPAQTQPRGGRGRRRRARRR
jgi:hypothetical protein